jgi:hypothetical protein
VLQEVIEPYHLLLREMTTVRSATADIGRVGALIVGGVQGNEQRLAIFMGVVGGTVIALEGLC